MKRYLQDSYYNFNNSKKKKNREEKNVLATIENNIFLPISSSITLNRWFLKLQGRNEIRMVSKKKKIENTYT